MKAFRRLGAAFVLSATLAIGLFVATPATASPVTTSGNSSASIGNFCEGLADVIAFLESRPPSPLRDYLLEQARRLFEKYC